MKNANSIESDVSRIGGVEDRGCGRIMHQMIGEKTWVIFLKGKGTNVSQISATGTNNK